MSETSQSYLSREPVGRLMRKYAVPCIISLLVGALYNIVDQIFIANARYLGSYGNAANTVVFPLTVIALAIAVMLGDGCCAFVSISFGKNQADSAQKSIGNAILLSVSASLVLCAVYLIFSDGIISMFGGTVNEGTFACSKEYFFWISVGIPFYMFGQAMNPIIRADGSPKFAMAATLAGAAANIVLDPLMIFGFKWGMMGAAVATVIGQIITALLSVWYLCHMKSVKLSSPAFRPDIRIIGRTLSLGACSFLAQISLVAAMAAINNMIRKYGALDPIFGQTEYAQIPMAVVGIVMKYFQIVISIVIGMAAGCIPIVGYNIGAGLCRRVKKLFTLLLCLEAGVGAVNLLIVECFPRQLIAIFGASNESIYYTDFAVKAFRIYLCMIIFACINKAAFIFLQAMGKAATSTMLSMLREIVFGVGFALLLPLRFGLDGVLWSMPVSDTLTLIASAIVIALTYRQLSDKKIPPLRRHRKISRFSPRQKNLKRAAGVFGNADPALCRMRGCAEKRRGEKPYPEYRKPLSNAGVRKVWLQNNGQMLITQSGVTSVTPLCAKMRYLTFAHTIAGGRFVRQGILKSAPLPERNYFLITGTALRAPVFVSAPRLSDGAIS